MDFFTPEDLMSHWVYTNEAHDPEYLAPRAPITFQNYSITSAHPVSSTTSIGSSQDSLSRYCFLRPIEGTIFRCSKFRLLCHLGGLYLFESISVFGALGGLYLLELQCWEFFMTPRESIFFSLKTRYDVDLILSCKSSSNSCLLYGFFLSNGKIQLFHWSQNVLFCV